VRPHDVEELAAALRGRLEGEVRFDGVSRLLYATDASIYQIVPVGVVIPKHAGDVVETVRIAAERGVPLLPRGSGTSLAGQAVGAALVLDFTKYMNEVLEVNPEERWVRVQPGVILDELNALLKPHGLMFAPDVATSNRASIGGMIGNNSCGARSILYGKTVDHLLELEAVLADGSAARLSEATPEEWARRGEQDTLEGRIYREVGRICRENAEEIDRRFPRIMRRVGGYNLDEIVRRQRYHLACLIAGSEGTLATVTEARLRLVSRPQHAGLLVSHFDDLIAALEAAPEICEQGPAAVELVDRIILDLTRDNLDLACARTFLQGDPEAILVTEFHGDTPAEVLSRLHALQTHLEGRGYAHVVIPDQAGQRDVWSVRKAGLGLLMGMKGDAKPAGFVEDTAVAPERLADYIREFRDLLSEYGLNACYYAHASVGCLHVRPILNLKDPADCSQMREIAGRVADLVLKYGGAMSAEHGDGLARSEWQEKMFGPQIYRAFGEVKRAFDPQGIMNPGKIVDAPPMNENLRIGPGYQTIPVLTTLDFSRDGGFARSVELCSGVGACRKKTDGTMCPSYHATLEEEHSTRGRANMLRLVLSGGPPDSPTLGGDGGGSRPASVGEGGGSGLGLADPRLHQVLDLCLECKACKSECPSNVDMAKLKYEFLSHYHAKHGTPLRARLFAHAAAMGRVGTAFSPLSNQILGSPWIRRLLDRYAGIDNRRKLPPFAVETFERWWRRRQADPRAGTRGEVILFLDTFANYHEPQVGRAAVRVLEAFGYRVQVPRLRCCGRPLISKGFLREAREHAAHNVTELARELARSGGNRPIIGLEPSCVVTLKDEYREFGLGPAADEAAENTWMLEDFLAAHHGDETSLPYRNTPRQVLLHGHCHQKAVLGTALALQALRMVPGYQVAEIPSGCCGMAGSFGYEKEHYDLSLKIGELSLFPRVRAAPEETLIVAPGTSCRHQMRDATGRTALHPAEVLALGLEEEPV
jgi:FAD/FMN-containing dehydrogenase/Fe-S oxidoreductase